MDYEAQKNCLIMGTFKLYCVLCEEVLDSRHPIFQHIESRAHINNFKSIPYTEKHKEDGIRQVRRGYHCEFCNVLLVTKPKVDHHINVDAHKHNKGMVLLKEVKNGVLAFNKVFIDNKAWHGLIDDSCAICDVDIADANEHTQDLTHIFNLIQMKVEFYDDNIFRKIDCNFFNCLTCNLIVPMGTFITHFQSGSHDRRYTMCRDLYNCYINGEFATGQTKNSISTYTDTSNKSDSVPKYLTENKAGISENDIDEKKKLTAVKHEDLKDNSSRNIKNTTSDAKNNGESSTSVTDTRKHDSESDQAKIYTPQEAFMLTSTIAKANGIKYRYGRQNAYCRSCDDKISSSLKRIEEHVSSPLHQNNVTRNKANAVWFITRRISFSL